MPRIKRSTRIIRWIEKHCVVPEGVDVGEPIKLRAFQRQWIRAIYDSPTRLAIISVGRKNAKTALAAMLSLVHLCGPEARYNSQLYSAAQSRDQAALLFDLARKIVRMSPTLSEFVTIRDTAKQLLCPELGTQYKAMSAEAPTAYGISPAFLVHDELGQVRGPRSQLYEALETSAGAQSAPLSLIISTQAPNDNDLLSTLIDDALAANDPRIKVFLHTADETLDPFSHEAQKQANPALGDFLNRDEVEQQAASAKRTPAREPFYRNLVLNQRVHAVAPFISPSTWKRAESPLDRSAFDHGTIYIGLDLSIRTDLTAAVAVAQGSDGVWNAWPFFWIPGHELAERAAHDRAPYDTWVEQGYIQATPGAAVDYEQVAYQLRDFCDGRTVAAVAFDRYHIESLQKELSRLDVELPLVEFGQGYKSMSPALTFLEGELLNGRVRHDGNPALTMCATNAVVTSDPAGSRKLDKSKATARIDGMVALVMAMGQAAQTVYEEPVTSPWEDPAFTIGAT